MLFKTQHPSVTIGTHGPWFYKRKIALGPELLGKHTHIMGTTGQGKSKFAAHKAASLILQGVPCSVIDPHADLTTDILALLTDQGYFTRPDAMQKLLYIEFSRTDGFLPFNVLQQPYPVKMVAENIFDAFSRAWSSLADGQAPRLENLIKAGVPVLVANNLPLTHLHDLLVFKNRAYREQLLQAPGIDHEIIKFFTERYEEWGKDAPLMVESTLSRVFLLSYTDALRYSLGQSENKLNFRGLLDNGVSVLFNLGKLDPNTRRLLGCLITVGFEQATLSRADLREHERTPYHLILDEFSQFTSQSSESVQTFLSEARKFKVFLTLLHQTWGQLSKRLQSAMQNTLHIVFNLGREDALWASQIFGRFDAHKIKHEVADEDVIDRTHPVFYNVQETFEETARHIEDLQPRQALIKLGTKTLTFTATHVPAQRCTYEQIEALKEQYARLLLTPLTTLHQADDTVPSSPSSLPSSQQPPRRRRVN